MCYTSGTTGHPKGVVYSHRSTVLHSMGALVADAAGGLRARHRDAGRADVPRQRLGPVPGGGDGGRVAGAARAEDAAEGARGADGVREGDAGRGRADDLDGRAARARGPRSLLPTRDPVRRVRRAAVAERGLPREGRAADPAGLGDDRDLAGGHHRAHQVDAAGPLRGRAGRPARRAGPGDPARGPADRRARHRRRAALGRRGARRAAGARAVDRGRLLQRRALGGLLHRGRLAAHRRRRDDLARTATSGSWTAPRTS